MCDSCPTNAEPDDDRLTWRDLDTETAELLRHDQAKTRDLPSLEELAAGFAPTYQCTYINCTDVAVQGHVCIRHERRIA